MSGVFEWLLGASIALGGHVILVLVAWAAATAFPGVYWISEGALVALFAPGLTQWLWVLPAVLVAGFAGRTRVLWGTLVTAGLVFLLNTACYGVIFGAMLTESSWN